MLGAPVARVKAGSTLPPAGDYIVAVFVSISAVWNYTASFGFYDEIT